LKHDKRGSNKKDELELCTKVLDAVENSHGPWF
jgi:hypothetical protein